MTNLKILLQNDLTNYRNALARLEEFLAEPVVSNRDRAGVIQAFEFTFELVWKVLQKIAQKQGQPTLGPKGALQFGIQASLLDPLDDELWVSMLDDRNLTTHTYKEDYANEIYNRIATKYVGKFKGFLLVLDKL